MATNVRQLDGGGRRRHVPRAHPAQANESRPRREILWSRARHNWVIHLQHDEVAAAVHESAACWTSVPMQNSPYLDKTFIKDTTVISMRARLHGLATERGRRTKEMGSGKAPSPVPSKDLAE